MTKKILTYVKLLFPAGSDTSFLGVGNTIYCLLTHPEDLERVAADPESECRWAGEEALRWEPPIPTLQRYNPRDVVWHDIPIPADTPLLFGIAAANRDPAVFEDPDRFDISRRQTKTLTFGFGVHLCIGAPLARSEIDISLKVLLERLPRLRLDTDVEDVRIMAAIPPNFRGPNRLPIRFD